MNFAREKETQTTPEMLGLTLLGVVGHEFNSIADTLEESNVSLDDYQRVEILQQVFMFYYSVFLLVIGTRYPSMCESTGSELDYGSLFLEEARKALADTDLPEHCKDWTSDMAQFQDIVRRGFSFYYHDTIPEEEAQTLEQVLKLTSCKAKDGPMYWSAKLQHRLNQIEPLKPNFKLFITLYLCNSIAVTELMKHILLKTQPLKG
jgi:hypothetical protein